MWAMARLAQPRRALAIAAGCAAGVAVAVKSQRVVDAESAPMGERAAAFVKQSQSEIVRAFELADGKAFKREEWSNGANHGIACVLQEGQVFEKVCVFVSVMRGTLPKAAVAQMRERGHPELDPNRDTPYFATGVSLVAHPHNPHAPTVHANFRYFEVKTEAGQTVAWFGGGADLTPSLVYDEDARHFHKTLKRACDRSNSTYYPTMKKAADEYFVIPHRKETRGVGGIFFDDMDKPDLEATFKFVQDAAAAFLPAYLPLLHKRKDTPFSQEEKDWQAIRRGRYAEFNLMYDRGTKFGLASPHGRVESILATLPLHARWEYEHSPAKGSRAEYSLQVFKGTRDWVST